MSVRTKTQRLLTFVLALALLLCWVPALGFSVSAAGSRTCLYDGVEFPSLPVYDSEKFPYVYIIDVNVSGANVVELWVSSVPFVQAKWKDNYTDAIVNLVSGGSMASYSCAGGEWVLKSEYSSVVTRGFGVALRDLNFIWCKSTILTSSGAVYKVGSAPVPVITSTITGIRIVSGNYTSIAAGFYFYITPEVIASGDCDPTITGTLSGATSSKTSLTLMDDGTTFKLNVGLDETAEKLTYTFTSVENPDVSLTRTIDVIYGADIGDSDAGDSDTGDSDTGDTDVTETTPGETVAPDLGDNETDTGDTATDEKEEANDQGEAGIEDLTDAITDHSGDFLASIQGFANAMSYTGTSAKLKIPAVMFPALGDSVSGFQMMEEMEIDFSEYVAMMPNNLLTLVQSLFTVALIVYCFKELYGMVAYFLTLKGGSS